MAREIKFYENYFVEFYLSLDSTVQEKIEYVFKLIRTVDRIPQKFLKHIESTDGLYEIRIKVGSDIYRVFCCFDKGKIVILFNGFQKKSQKTPKKEIDKALRLKNEYFNNKKGD
ncbi:type II toxin-antitoxin system RelE/ParE family toxin [Geofilum rubicundum]|jgi:phage-related protein|uniref:type II toxin-antitoxin system RelE/ParE family toxin n=1 Tax=Geofilum rubicundum TaxID=472113 RepID=UPI0007835F95|nr:type II toxin-antitoxin system RelE/ParE family toxin [Geofilum rubicundum]